MVFGFVVWVRGLVFGVGSNGGKLDLGKLVGVGVLAG